MMGQGKMAVVEDGDGVSGKLAAAISCSICLDEVVDDGARSWAKLQCGHRFHLDCIGSAFNSKGSMQCPNCRKVEKGQWLYANGGRPTHEFSLDDWGHDEDLYDLGYSEMSFGVHWCPFSGLTRIPTSFDEGDFSSSLYQDFLGHHAVLAEHTSMSSTTHPSPYIAFIGPIHASSSASNMAVADVSSFNNHWSGSSEVPNSYAFPSVDLNLRSWDHSNTLAANSSNNGADRSSIPSVTQRTTRNTSDMPRPGMHPQVFGHSSASRGPSSVTSSMFPAYPGAVARTREQGPSGPQYFQQFASNPSAHTAGGRRSSGHRGFTPVASPSGQPSGFVFFQSSSSGRAYQELENPHHVWERERELERQYTFPSGQVDNIWGPVHVDQLRGHGHQGSVPTHTEWEPPLPTSLDDIIRSTSRPPTGGSDTVFRSNGSRQRHNR